MSDFWSHVFIHEDDPDSCWIWLGPHFVGDGYGRYKTPSKVWRAHRYSYTIMRHKTLLGVLHKCNNIICVNPNHLYAGNNSDNIKDCVRAGNHINARKTHCPSGHEYNQFNTRTTKASRSCRVCDRIRRRVERQS
jgi:hypothetical protein